MNVVYNTLPVAPQGAADPNGLRPHAAGPHSPVDLRFLCSAVWVFIGPLGSLLGGVGIPYSAFWGVHEALGSLLGTLWVQCSAVRLL